MNSQFLIKENTVISFSGGRTSAFMLYKVLESNNGLPDNCKVLFCNTGKEAEETLVFVKAVQDNWNVPITWLEYRQPSDYAVVDFDTASRNGEPFESIIQHRKMLPNNRARFCTVELKIRTMSRYIKRNLQWDEWTQFIGIRADEARRAVKLAPDSKGEEPFAPLYHAGITKAHVDKFWESQPFKLKLPIIDGETIGGNCDLCFLKSTPKILTLIKHKPQAAIWWAKQEDYAKSVAKTHEGSVFRLDRPKYEQLANFLDAQKDMFDDNSIECFCGD